MKRMLLWAAGLLLLAGCGGTNTEKAVTLNGAGATFPSPVYANWTYNFTQFTHGQTQVNYQGVGSGAGVRQLREGTIDFAGTDSPLTAEELEKEGFAQIPMLAGGVVVVVNIPGVETNRLNLDAAVLADIYLGKITKWNAPEIARDNPDLTLPDLEIVPIYRADGSGTSFLFTSFLSKVSPAWKSSVGAGAAVRFPVGLGGQKNPGVCNNVMKIPGSVGYTEYTYAVEMKLACVCLRNAAGKCVVPNSASFTASLAGVDWKEEPGFRVDLTNAPGENSYPVTGVTYLVYRKTLEEPKRSELFRYIAWCFRDGKAKATEMEYVPLPPEVVEVVLASLGESK
ncbi:MAG: phosphate ABC transporter substrate-binding protein PstS [Planctomycetia bacterium]|nr:phosphate ABC transporter substrate-binding protein PstS [Planctomycetia bacterium]